MGKNVILSEDTVRDLLEAHASLSAWYYELWAALRSGNASPGTPDDAARSAFVERLASDFPEIASIARSIRVPRLFVPAPPTYAIAPDAAGAEPRAATNASSTQAPEPPPAAEASSGATPQSAPEASPTAAPAKDQPAVAPPPFVVPSKVKYEP